MPFVDPQISIYEYFIHTFHFVLVLKEALVENYKTTYSPKHDRGTATESNWKNRKKEKFHCKG